MKVSYKLLLGGKEILIEQECENDCEVFKFLNHMQELFDNNVCEKNGKKSDKVRVNVRVDSDENEYFELVCVDPKVPDCNYAKRKFGVTKKGHNLFPKNKDSEGNWNPWVKYNKETGKEE